MKRLILPLALLCMLASACAPAAGADSPPALPAVIEAPALPQAWIDAPLNGSVLPPGTVELTSHAASPDGIAQVERSVNGAVVRTDPNPQPGQVFTLARQAWLPRASGNYTLSVRAQSTSGAWSSPASVTITILEATPAPSPTAAPSQTPTTAPTLTATPSGPLTIVLVRNSFCRQGPGQVYREITALAAGDNAEIRGKSQDAAWLFIYWPKFNVECWIVTAAAPANTDLSAIPALAAPPTPIPSAIPPTSVPLTPTPTDNFKP